LTSIPCRFFLFILPPSNYSNLQIPLDTPVGEVMSTTLHPATPDMGRDEVGLYMLNPVYPYKYLA
jgi:hypothetical protein